MNVKQCTDRQIELKVANHKYEHGLIAYAFFKTNDRAMSVNFTQDTFMKTWQYLVKGGNILNMKAFLYHIMNNLIVDEYRKHSTASLDVLLEKGFEPSIDGAEDIINLLDGKTAAFLIQHLPVTYQRTMDMHFVQDKSLTEISFITKQSKNAIAVQIHRGLKKMRLLCVPDISLKI